MRRFLTTLMLSTALAGPLAAQEARVDGTVAEVFGRQAIITAPEGRILVALPDGVAAPAPGTRVELRGTRSGDSFAATALNIAGVAPTGAGEVALPVEMRGLGLTEVRTRTERGRRGEREIDIHARMPGGGWLLAEIRDGRLVEVKTDGTAMPQPLVERLLPAGIRGDRSFAGLTRITDIDIDRDGEIEVKGLDEAGMRIEIEYAPGGAMISFERERDDRRSLPVATARARLNELGYRQIGFVDRTGRHNRALATNTYGEWVEVRLDEQGRVDRERRWDR